jgi:hypothetical protein
MTALQDWLSNRPTDASGLKAFICDAIRGLTGEEEATVADLPLMGRGVERC